MLNGLKIILTSILCVGCCWNASAEDAIDFQLKDIHGKSVSLQRDFAGKKAVVVAFLGVECPLVKLYAKRLNSFAKKCAENDIGLLAINSNRQDSIEELQAFARRHDIDYPLLKDPGNKVADLFKATRTPEVFVLSSEYRVVYQGAIDDQFHYGVQKSKPGKRYLQNALQEFVAGKPISVSKTESIGCIIGRKLPVNSSSDVTFHNQISRIFQTKCVRCHRDGELAPFALEDYDEVAGWAGMIEEVIREHRMPPWHADAKPGVFKNDARLTDDEKQLVFDWVKAGAPEGKKSDAPRKMEFAQGWQIGTPDRIIKMRQRPFKVPATGQVDYKYFRVKSGFKEDKWIKAAECRPGNRGVVHHIIVGVRGEGEFGRRDGSNDALESEWIAATAPGAPPMVLPDGYAKFVPAGAELIFQLHYTPNGTPQEDLSEFGLVFAEPETVKKRVITLMSFNDRIKIPAGEDNYRISSSMTLKQDVELMTMFPHMHYRGKKFRYEFKVPGGKYETLLNVPYYDFNWQNAYELSQYRTLPKGTRLKCVAHFDNSEKNLANPDPTKLVRWGDQTWEEMMIGYFDVAIDVPSKQDP